MIFLTTILSLIPLTTLTLAVRVDPVYKVEIPGVILYEKTVPILFQVLLPVSIGDTLLVTNKPGCNVETSPYYCPLIFYLQQVADDLRNIITIEQSLNQPESDLPDMRNLNCENSNFLFPSLFTNNAQVTETTNTTLPCLEQPQLITGTYLDYEERQWINLYSEALTKYEQYNPANSSETERSAMIAQEVLNVGGFLHYFAERTRWEDSVNRCKLHHVLPPHIISKEMLQTQLNRLEPIALGKGYEFALPTTTLSSYWTLPTVDCTLNTNNKVLSVVLSVPLKKEGSSWSLYKLASLPFHTVFEGKNYTCHVSEFEEESIINFDSTTSTSYPYPGQELSPGFLQFQSSQPKGFMKDLSKSCASKIIANGTLPIDIVSRCPLTCELITNTAGNPAIMVRMVSSNTFVVAKASNSVSSLEVTCTSGPTPIPLPIQGGIKLTLGCGCSFPFGGMRVEPTIPCENNGGVVHEEVIPVNLETAFINNIKFLS